MGRDSPRGLFIFRRHIEGDIGIEIAERITVLGFRRFNGLFQLFLAGLFFLALTAIRFWCASWWAARAALLLFEMMRISRNTMRAIIPAKIYHVVLLKKKKAAITRMRMPIIIISPQSKAYMV